jgi:hypothetical protein
VKAAKATTKTEYPNSQRGAALLPPDQRQQVRRISRKIPHRIAAASPSRQKPKPTPKNTPRNNSAFPSSCAMAGKGNVQGRKTQSPNGSISLSSLSQPGRAAVEAEPPSRALAAELGSQRRYSSRSLNPRSYPQRGIEMRIAIIAMLALVCAASNAHALPRHHQRQHAAQCVETGTVLKPVCGLLRCPTPASLSLWW